MANTPYMNLDLPVVSVTLGTTWATKLNTALDLIDEHDHSSLKGKQVPTSGLNINADLSLNSFSLFSALSLKFDSQSVALSGTSYASSLSVAGGNLYYTNSAGTAIQITSGGSVIAAPGAAISFTVTATSGDLSIGPSDGFVVVSVNTSTTANEITLPNASAVSTGRIYIVKDSSGDANVNAITITPNGTDTIDGAASVTVDSSYGSLMLIGDGSSNWQIV